MKNINKKHFTLILLSSLLTLKKKNDEDSKKQKKFEKEEKEFRKKFKVCLSIMFLSIFINAVLLLSAEILQYKLPVAC